MDVHHSLWGDRPEVRHHGDGLTIGRRPRTRLVNLKTVNVAPTNLALTATPTTLNEGRRST